MCGKKLVRAQKLIGGLGGEKTRWTHAAEALQITYDNLLGDVLISSGVIGYLGPFTAPFREECITDWIRFVNSKKIACSSAHDYSLSKTLGEPIKIQQWNIFGLPKDAFSTRNQRSIALFVIGMPHGTAPGIQTRCDQELFVTIFVQT